MWLFLRGRMNVSLLRLVGLGSAWVWMPALIYPTSGLADGGTKSAEACVAESVSALSSDRIAIIGHENKSQDFGGSFVAVVDLKEGRLLSQVVYRELQFELLRGPLIGSDGSSLVLSAYSKEKDRLKSSILAVDCVTGGVTTLYTPTSGIVQNPQATRDGKAVVSRNAITSELLHIDVTSRTAVSFTSGAKIPRLGYCVSNTGQSVFHGRVMTGLWNSSLAKGARWHPRKAHTAGGKFVDMLWMQPDSKGYMFTDSDGVLWWSLLTDEWPRKVSDGVIATGVWSNDSATFAYIQTEDSGSSLFVWTKGECVRVMPAMQVHMAKLPVPSGDCVFVSADGVVQRVPFSLTVQPVRVISLESLCGLLRDVRSR